MRIKEENQTLATVTLQNYFRSTRSSPGMTGTASTEAGEFAHTYGLEVVSIPTNRPMVRADEPDLIYKTEEAKFDAVADDIQERYDDRPAGARRHDLGREVRAARRACSSKRGIPHAVLNAKQHEREAHIVTQAGRLARRSPSPPTWPVAASTSCSAATPRAWPAARCSPRGSTPDESTRSATTELARASSRRSAPRRATSVRELGGLYVLGTERHESRRIDNQLRGRAGPPGRPGREPLLPVARGRPHAAVRDRAR